MFRDGEKGRLALRDSFLLESFTIDSCEINMAPFPSPPLELILDEARWLIYFARASILSSEGFPVSHRSFIQKLVSLQCT